MSVVVRKKLIMFVLLLCVSHSLNCRITSSFREESGSVLCLSEEASLKDGRQTSLPVEALFCPFTTCPQVGHSRSQRLPISYATGKGGRNAGRGTVVESSGLSRYCPQCLRQYAVLLRETIAPPRFYYVIALQRILC